MLKKNPYNSKVWKKLRARQLKKYPYCQECGVIYSLQIDHIKEHENNIELFLDPNNLQTLCIKCHAKKTRQYQTRTGKTNKTQNLTKYYNYILTLKQDNAYKLIILLNQPNSIPLNDKYNTSDLLANSSQIWGYSIYVRIANKTIQNNEIEIIKKAITKIFIKNKFYTQNIEIIPNLKIDKITNFIKKLNT